jgi:tetratricopeptide (TPR) repeat protein
MPNRSDRRSARHGDTSNRSPAALLNESIALHEKGRHEEALALLDRALKMPSNSDLTARLWIQRSRVLQDLGRLDEALEAADRAIAAAPEFAPAWDQRATNLAALHRDAEALDAVERAIVLDPIYADGWLRKAGLLSRLGRHTEAVTALDDALRAGPRSVVEQAGILTDKGRALIAARRYREAVEPARLATVLAPDDWQMWLTFGDALIMRHRYEDAHTAFERALALAPTDPGNWASVAFARYWADRPHEALAAYDEARRLAPDWDTAPWADARMYRARLLARLIVRGEAPAGMDPATEPGLADPEVWADESKVLLRDFGRRREALRAAEEALARDPYNPKAAVYGAIVLFVSGHPFRAIASIARPLRRVQRPR